MIDHHDHSCIHIDSSGDLGEFFAGGIARPIVALLQHRSIGIRQICLKIICQLTGSDQDRHTQFLINVGLLPSLHVALLSSNQSILTKALFIASNILGGTTSQMADLINQEIVCLILPLIQEEVVAVQREAASEERNNGRRAVGRPCVSSTQ